MIRVSSASMRAGVLIMTIAVLAACDGPPASSPAEAKGSGSGSSSGSSSSSAAAGRDPTREKPDPFRATGGPGDVFCAYVRPERSSRLDASLPRAATGLSPHGRSAFRVPLDVALQPQFVLTAGNRIAVVGRSTYATFDDRGRTVESGKLEGPPSDTRIDRGGGAILFAPDERASKFDTAHHFAAHGDLLAVASPGSLRVIDRSGEVRPIIDGKFDALGISIDDEGTAHALVRTDVNELAVWSAPTAYGGSVGRKKLGRHRRDRNETPPILGRTVHVVVLDDRIVALAPDGKKVWERIGALTGGATITADDRLLTASDSTILSIDANGRATKLVDEPRVVFVTPPILDAKGALVVASGSALHAYAFD